MKKASGLLITIASLGALLVGCKEEPSQQNSGETHGVEQKKELKDTKVGMSMYTLGAPYFAAQVSIDLLILNPKDPQGLIPATKAATKAGVPVIVIDSTIDAAADFVTTIQSNNLANGEMIGQWLVNRMKGEPIRMALISGVPGNPVGKERRQGVFRGIIEQQLRATGRMGFEIVAQGWGDWYHEGGLKAMEDIIVAHPEINVMLAENDSMALGALEAIKEAGREDDILVLAAADGQKEALKLIKEGRYGATGMNNPVLIAETAIEVGLQVLRGKTDFPKISYTPAVCISRDNVDRYYDPDA
ncbi:MAG: substrate-binding domain-containing protein, partial [Planctomycetota bacterium]